MYYQEHLNELPHPWDMMLRDTYLLPSASATLLVVPERAVALLSSFEVLAKVYPIARKLYPETKSLLVVFGPEYDHVKDGTLDIVDVKVVSNE